jgi:hypothetical protein
MPNPTPCNMKKTRPDSNPYEVYTNGQGWEWRVLKSWQNDRDKPYARAFCAVSSPFTFGGCEFGDVYWSEILASGTLTETNYGE